MTSEFNIRLDSLFYDESPSLTKSIWWLSPDSLIELNFMDY